MKVTIIKGPLFEQRKEQAYELLYKIIQEEVKKSPKTA
ncbi:hypothetical protein NEOCIP111885_01709 [Pseudoneobacillus rhizosphaerae]|jgi:hypothetical protein|uniref:Uncharacterized protein n=1 Tax=Pseudoneobacillus rhizosphaerae TaxID=2880968 RepID=A0A9C7G9G2_9BACI|nr:hypothetical protein NEOCIP111885_01709 [Pseudoneobacillus rhizosphaerae]